MRSPYPLGKGLGVGVVHVEYIAKDHSMIRLSIDCNWREGLNNIVVREQDVITHGLKAGDRVILQEPGLECEAILRRGEIWPWVADIVDGTIKDIPVEESPLS